METLFDGAVSDPVQPAAPNTEPSPSPAANRRFWWAVSASGICIAGFLAWLAFGFFGDRVTLAVDDLAGTVTALVAAVTCSYRATRERGRLRWGWMLLGQTGLWWGLGMAAWSYYELVAGREVPFPSPADAGFLLAVPMALASMLAFFSPPAGWTSRLRVVVDGLIVASSVLFVSWFTVLGALYRSAEGSWLARAITVAYPAGDVVVISMVLLVWSRSRSNDRLPMGWISAGLLGLAFSDSAFAYLILQGDYATGNLIDAGWFAGFLILALAGLKPRSLELSGRRLRGELTLLPYVPVLGVLALTTARALQGQAIDGFLFVNLSAVFIFVVIRQILTLWENRALTCGLEAKVAERTVEVQRSEERFRSLIQNVSDVISVIGSDGTIRYVSPSVLDVFGHRPDELTGTNLFNLLHPDDATTMAAFFEAAGVHSSAVRRLEVRICHGDGGWRHAEAIGTDMSADPALGGFVLVTRDVTERKELEEQLAHQAFHDPLTGLANRALLADRLQHALTRIGRTGQDLAVVFIDLDDFKSVNDTLGHAPGDELLREVTRRLTACVRSGDTVARLGGDEFAVLMEEATVDAAVGVAQRLHQALEFPVTIEGAEIQVTASTGIATSGPETASAAEVLRNADVAMYRAKGAGKARHEVFRPEMHQAVVRRVALLAELRRAVDRGEFELHYQPVVELEGELVVGFEALLRWQHPERGIVPPLEFIPALEETGLIVPLGGWILREALSQLRAWDALDREGPPLTMSVNVSGQQLQMPGLVTTVFEALAGTGIAPHRLTLELTESILLEDAEATIDRLAELKELGVLLAIDDFGTGFSSLSYLRRFPVDLLKIDRSFVRDLGSERGAELTRTMVELGTVLGMDTVAEGIEETGQALVLRQNGCRLGQGYLFSRPLTRADATALLSLRPAPATT